MLETQTKFTDAAEHIKSSGRILVDWEIREYVRKYRMLDPFEERLKREGVISYGLSSMGYDIRVTDEYKVFTNLKQAVVDPKQFSQDSFVDFKGAECIIPPNSFALARSVEYFRMPRSILGICLPTFVVGPLLVLVFGLWLHWLPVAGWNGWQDRVLPSMTLGFAYAAYISRLTRGGLMEIRNQDFIRTARAKGLSETQILLKHSLRGGLLPVVTFLGPALAGIITGALVTETIFNIPGLGRFFIQSAINRDYTVVLGTALLYFTLIFVCNLLVDIFYVILDPRVRYD